MKYLIVVLVVVVVGWLLLRGRSRPSGRARRGAAREPGPQAMVQCAHCGVHLPRGDAVLDRSGAFCSEAHQPGGAARRS